MPKSEREEHRRQETEKKDNDKLQILNAKSKLDRIYRIIINCWKNGIAKCLNNEILEWWNSVQKKATEFTIQERESNQKTDGTRQKAVHKFVSRKNRSSR